MKLFNEEKFESIFVDENVNHNDSKRLLEDDEYISYHIWLENNWRELYKKHLHNTRVLKGDNPNLIFHGGCLGCKSQRLHGVDRCKGCCFFKANSKKPNLFIKGEYSSKMTQQDINDFLKGDIKYSEPDKNSYDGFDLKQILIQDEVGMFSRSDVCESFENLKKELQEKYISIIEWKYKNIFWLSIKEKDKCLFSRRNGIIGKLIFGYSVVLRLFNKTIL